MSKTKFHLQSPEGYLMRFERDREWVRISHINFDGEPDWVVVEIARTIWRTLRNQGWERYEWDFSHY